MNATKAISLEGTIMSVLPGTMFRVALANNRLVLAHISGKMRKRFIRLTIGDRVKMEMSPYDTAKARIVYRLNTLIYGNTIPVRSAATTKTKDRHRSQELAGALSFNVEADRYRTHHKRKALADRQSESAKVHLCALRRRSYLDKRRRGSRSPASISI